MMRRFTDLIVRALVATLLSAGLAHPALACACCSEIGQRIDHTGPMDSYVRAEWSAVRFAPTARLFADAGFPDTVEGVAAPSDQDYRLKMLRTPKSLMIAVTDAADRVGTIEMQIPKELTRFEVDPREPGVAAHGLGPRPLQGMARTSACNTRRHSLPARAHGARRADPPRPRAQLHVGDGLRWLDAGVARQRDPVHFPWYDDAVSAGGPAPLEALEFAPACPNLAQAWSSSPPAR